MSRCAAKVAWFVCATCLMIASAASAQDWTTGDRQVARAGVGGLRLPGQGLPEYPRASIRVQNGVLYVEATQEDDSIGLVDQTPTTLGVLILNARHNVDVGEYVDSRDVELIVVYGLAGDDDLFTSTDIPVLFFGGLGNDTWRRE